MKQALILYHSRNDKTKKYAERIGYYFNSLNIEANVLPIEKYRKDLLTSANYVMLGCWTKGLFLLNQKPDKVWIDFVKSLPLKRNQAIGLFTTYNIREGSMFNNMRRHLINVSNVYGLEIKSRNGRLSEENKGMILNFLNQSHQIIFTEVPEKNLKMYLVNPV